MIEARPAGLSQMKEVSMVVRGTDDNSNYWWDKWHPAQQAGRALKQEDSGAHTSNCTIVAHVSLSGQIFIHAFFVTY